MSENINSVSYLQLFRVYYLPGDQSGTTYSLFNNNRQMIPVTVEILARDSNDRQVILSPAELASIRLAGVDSAGNTTFTLPHTTSPGSAAWHTRNASQGYSYDPRIVDELGKVVKQTALSDTSPDDIPQTVPDAPFPIMSGGNTPDSAQYVTLYVATMAKSGITLAAIFQGYSSAKAAGSRPESTLHIVPKTLDSSLLTLTTEEVLVSGSQAEGLRTYNKYIALFSSRYQRKIPVKDVAGKPGIWWYLGDEWRAEYSISYLVGPGVSRRDWLEHAVPFYMAWNGLITTDALERVRPGNGVVENPRTDEAVLITTLDPLNFHLYWDKDRNIGGGTQRAVDATLYDTYGNLIPIRVTYAKNDRDTEVYMRPANFSLPPVKNSTAESKTVNRFEVRLASGSGKLWTNGRQQVQVEIEVQVSDASGKTVPLSETERSSLRLAVSRYRYGGEDNTDDNDYVILPDTFRAYGQFGEWQASETSNGYREHPDSGKAENGAVKTEFFDYYLACRTDGGTARMEVCALLTLDTGERYCTNGLTWDADGNEEHNSFTSKVELIRVPAPSLSEVLLEVTELNGDNPGGYYNHFRTLNLQYQRTGAASIRKMTLHADTPGMIQWNYPDSGNQDATYTAYASPGDTVFSVSQGLPPEANNTKPELPAGLKGNAVVALCGRTSIPYSASYDRFRGPCDLILEDVYGNIWLCQMNFLGKTGEAGREDVTFTLTTPRY